MKFCSVWRTLFFLVLFSNQLVAQEQIVFTLYFSGTGMDQSMWQESASVFGQAETIASLFRYQIVSGDVDNQVKGIVDGFSGVQRAVPNWDEKFDSAIDRLQPALTAISCEQCVILNLIGFSRGAVSTMHLAHRLTTDLNYRSLFEKIGRINIIVFDPVPGDLTLNSEVFNLPAQVANFVGFYSEDERTTMFSPVIPEASENSGFPPTRLHFFSVPGSHETMVGSRKSDGHAHNDLPLGEPVSDVNSLGHLSELLKISIATILGSEAWGQVRYSEEILPNLANLEQLKAPFDATMEAVYTTDNREWYAGMRELSFLDPLNMINPTEAWSTEDNDGCRLDSLLFSAADYPRCVYVGEFSENLLGFPNSSLEQVDGLIPVNTIEDTGDYALWNLIESYYLTN